MDNQLNFRYHELVDKQMLESLSALEKEELDALKMQLDEIDESNETLQRAEVQMDARRRLLDEQLEKISGQLKALLEQKGHSHIINLASRTSEKSLCTAAHTARCMKATLVQVGFGTIVSSTFGRRRNFLNCYAHIAICIMHALSATLPKTRAGPQISILLKVFILLIHVRRISTQIILKNKMMEFCDIRPMQDFIPSSIYV
jgi:hypothetical protein